MKDYNHTSSPVIEKIEANFESEAEKKYDLPLLHDLYEQVRYRFLPANVVYKMMVEEHYRFNNVLECIDEDEFTQWYNEMLRINPPTIEVGTPATVYYWSDRRAATITMVEYFKNSKKDAAGNPIPKKIGVNLNEVKCIDYYAGDYEVIPMTDPEQLKLVHDTFTFRKGGRWISEGNTTGDGLSLGIGYQDHYIDPSF